MWPNHWVAVSCLLFLGRSSCFPRGSGSLTEQLNGFGNQEGPLPQVSERDNDQTVQSNDGKNVSDEEAKIVVTMEDLERLGFPKIPHMCSRYYESGADQEQTLSENRLGFRRLRFRPRVLIDVAVRNQSVTVLGEQVSMPVGIAPSAFHMMAHPIGENGTALAASCAQTIMILSTLSTISLEGVAEASQGGMLWFQLYVYKNRSLTESLVRRAENAGFKALVLTVDAPMFGQRICDVKHKFALPENLTLGNFDTSDFSNLGSKGGSGLAEYADSLFDASLTWEAVDWLRNITRLPIVLKGIMTGEDAKIAVEHNVSAILVSNHGGRQLDGVAATIEVLPEIVRAVGNSSIEVYLDGGIRHGTDVVKALALGARFVFVGRPALYGLAYNGTHGVIKVLDILKKEVDRSMALLGCSSVGCLTPALVTRQETYSRFLTNISDFLP